MSLGHSSALLVTVSLISGTAVGDAIVIGHEPPACMVAGKFPEVEAQVDAAATLKSARVYFHATGARFWSYAEMTVEKGTIRASLSRPPGRAEVYYHIVATDVAGAASRTPEYLVQVVRSPGECSDPRRVAKALDSPLSRIGRGEPVPAAASPSKGIGGKTVGLVVLGAAAAGGAIVAATSGGGGSSAPAATSGTFAGTLDGYAQTGSGQCPWVLNVVPGGTISLTLSTSGAAASFGLPPGIYVGTSADPACVPPAGVPAANAVFSQVVVSGGSVTGRAVVRFQTFVLHAVINGSSLGGEITVSGGPLGSQWSSATVTIHGSRSP